MKISAAALLSIIALTITSTDAQTLAKCRAACRAGTAGWNVFCRGIPTFPPWLIPIKGACWGFGHLLSTPGGQVACTNWCYNWLGDRRSLATEEELRIELKAAGINPDDIDFQTGQPKNLKERDAVEWSA